MKIGLIVYSQTGNTVSVAEKIKVKLEEQGHTVTLEQIRISGKTPAQPGKFELTDIPAVEGYEALILGAPVQAFSLNPVMKTYLAQLPKLDGKKVALFVTKGLSALWLGGTGAIKIMKQECESRGAKVVGSAIVPWGTARREDIIKQAADSMGAYFKD
jgi:flavodoxin